MKARLLLYLDAFRSSYWFIPTLMLVGSAALAVALVALDERVENEELRGLVWMFSGGAEGARSLLSTVAGSVIAVAGTTFSITIAVLSLTSSQYGPRLLRGFLRDTSNQMVLGTFLGTFLYCLLVLRTVRSVEETYFVPHIAVTGGVALAIASVCMLVYFIHHITGSIQISHIIEVAGQDLDAAIERLFPEQIGQGGPEAHGVGAEGNSMDSLSDATLWQDARIVPCRKSGYVQAIDGDALMALTADSDLVLRTDRRPGQFVTEGGILARFILESDVDNMPQDDLIDGVNGAFSIGSQRTATQDLEFLFQQLTEVAVRALSPGINDPFTALMCLDRLGAALGRLAGRRMPSPFRHDAAGVVRVFASPVSFAEVTECCFDSIRNYGRNDVRVMCRLLEVISVVATRAHTPAQRTALLGQATQTRQAALETLQPGEIPERIEVAYRSAVVTLVEREVET